MELRVYCEFTFQHHTRIGGITEEIDFRMAFTYTNKFYHLCIFQ